MSTPDFEDVLSKKVAETEKPKPKPVGTYLAMCVGHPAFKTIKVDGADKKIVSFTLKAQTALEDVSQTALADAPEIMSWPGFKYDIFYEGDGEWNLKKFLVDVLGIEEDEKTYREMLAESPGRQLRITLIHKPYTNKQTGEAEIVTNIGAVSKA